MKVGKIIVRLKEIFAADLKFISWFSEFRFIVHEKINSPVSEKIIKGRA